MYASIRIRILSSWEMSFKVNTINYIPIAYKICMYGVYVNRDNKLSSRKFFFFFSFSSWITSHGKRGKMSQKTKPSNAFRIEHSYFYLSIPLVLTYSHIRRVCVASYTSTNTQNSHKPHWSTFIRVLEASILHTPAQPSAALTLSHHFSRIFT